MKTIFLFILFVLSLCARGQSNSILKGNQLYKAGQFEQAEIQYRKVLETDPNNTSAMFNLANALHRQGKFDEATRINGSLAKATKDKTLVSAAWYNQGVSYSKLNNLEASIESYKNSLRQNPSDQQVRENLEKALLQLKKQQQQQQQQKQKQSSDLSQKEADQKLKQLQQREKELQQKMNKKSQGGGQSEDW
jgi:Ca-activated chloride channel family protein